MTPNEIHDVICQLIERRVIVLSNTPQDTGIAKFAQLIGVHRRTVMRWLSGESKPSPEMMKKIKSIQTQEH